MTSPAAVTLIMPVMDGAPFIGAAIESLLAQTFPDFTLIVIDDASTDGTRAIVESYQDQRVRLLCNSRQEGPAAARNRGLEHSDSPVIGFLDSDDIAEPDRLERQLACLHSHPGVGLVATRARIIDQHGRPTGEIYGWNEADELIAPRMLFRNWLPTSSIVVDRAVIGDDRFDPALEVGSDYDMWLRVIARTHAISLPAPLVRYRIYPANLTNRRRDRASACLERIAERQFARLGVIPTPAEMRTHLGMATGPIDGSLQSLRAAEAWLVRLERANTEHRLYAHDAFQRVLDDEWLAVCDAVARGGCLDAWPMMARSPRTRRLITRAHGRRGMAMLPWRTMRGYIRRRWPALGPGIRRRVLQALLVCVSTWSLCAAS